MSNKVKIAIDAMGGENSPKKIVEGIDISLKSNQSRKYSCNKILIGPLEEWKKLPKS